MIKVEINFTCPFCKKDIKDSEAKNIFFDEDNMQMVHLSCFKKHLKKNKMKKDDSKNI